MHQHDVGQSDDGLVLSADTEQHTSNMQVYACNSLLGIACFGTDLEPCAVHGHATGVWVNDKVKHHALNLVPVFTLFAWAQKQWHTPD